VTLLRLPLSVSGAIRIGLAMRVPLMGFGQQRRTAEQVNGKYVRIVMLEQVASGGGGLVLASDLELN
jgi:hypothetical protein